MRNGRTFAAGAFAVVLLVGLLNACSEGEPGEEVSSKPSAPSNFSDPTPQATPTLSERERRIARKEAAEARRKARAAARREREEVRRERAEAEVALPATMTSLFSYYNSEDFIHASAYVDDRFVRKCGGTTDLAYAFAQNKDTERLNYTLDNLKITRFTGPSVRADVTFSSRDDESGELVDDHFAVGLSFVTNPRRDKGWVLDDLFPLGVGAYC